MLKKPTELDEAEMRLLMRQQCKNSGYLGSLQMLYEIYFAAQTLIQVIQEEFGEKK